jgi:hypothetical protein
MAAPVTVERPLIVKVARDSLLAAMPEQAS